EQRNLRAPERHPRRRALASQAYLPETPRAFPDGSGFEVSPAEVKFVQPVDVLFRSAPVLGRSNHRTSMRLEKARALNVATSLRPGDGRTPPENTTHFGS